MTRAQLKPYAGSPQPVRVPRIAEGGPVGPRGVAFLRRVRAARGAYRINRNVDRDALDRTLSGGFVRRSNVDHDAVFLTDAGAAYLDRLMRVE